MNWQKIFTPHVIEEIASVISEVGLLALSADYKSLDIQEKMDNSIVTDIDLKISDLIIKELGNLTPGIAVVTEENLSDHPWEKRQNYQSYWLVDPLDGTGEFARGGKHFSHMVAFIEEGRPVFGMIYNPVLDQWVYALKGQGCYRFDVNFCSRIPGIINKIEIINQIKLDNSNAKIPNHLNILVGRREVVNKHPTLDIKPEHSYLIIRSAGVKSSQVALFGNFLYLCVHQLGEWDVAAADIIVSESGGALVDIYSRTPIIYNQNATPLVENLIFVPNAKWLEQDLYTI